MTTNREQGEEDADLNMHMCVLLCILLEEKVDRWHNAQHIYMLLRNRNDDVLTPLLYTRSVKSEEMKSVDRLCGCPLARDCFRSNSSSREEIKTRAAAPTLMHRTGNPIFTLVRVSSVGLVPSFMCTTLVACCLHESSAPAQGEVMVLDHAYESPPPRWPVRSRPTH